MTLLPPEIAELLPPLCARDGNPDAPLVLKVFDPCAQWAWCATEYDPEEKLLFGLVVGFEEELGYFSRTCLAGFCRPARIHDGHTTPLG